MADKIKMLFSNAPPDALEKLLSPRRKLIYGFFAFGPGTILGLYLYSVKKRMERENECMRLDQVESEINAVHARYDKELVLADAIQEMRDRLRQLEEETRQNRQNAAKDVSNAGSKVDKENMQTLNDVASPSESKIDAALAVLKSSKQSDGNEQKLAASPNWLESSSEGLQGRRDERHNIMLQKDVAAYIAKQKEQIK